MGTRPQLSVLTMVAAVSMVLLACGGGGGLAPVTEMPQSTTIVAQGAPSNHGLSPMDPFTVQPGATVERGNVEVSCPAGGPACVLTVAADGSVQYERTGGMPSVMASLDPGPQQTAVRLVYGTSNRDSFVNFFAPTRQPELIPTRAEVDRYLRTFDASGQPRRFSSPPVVRFAAGTAPERRETALRGIHAPNAYLPYDRHTSTPEAIWTDAMS